MYVNIYIYMFIYIFAHTHIYIYIYMYIYVIVINFLAAPQFTLTSELLQIFISIALYLSNVLKDICIDETAINA